MGKPHNFYELIASIVFCQGWKLKLTTKYILGCLRKRRCFQVPSLARESRNKRGRYDVYVLLCDLGTLDGMRTHRCTHQRISIFSCSFKLLFFKNFPLLFYFYYHTALQLQLPAKLKSNYHNTITFWRRLYYINYKTQSPPLQLSSKSFRTSPRPRLRRTLSRYLPSRKDERKLFCCCF